MEETQIYKVLQGYRHKMPADLAHLEQIIVSFSNLIVDFPEIAEMDINPLVVSEGRFYALNARIVLDGEYTEQTPRYPHLIDRIADAGIDVRFIADRVGETRGLNAEGKKVYTLSDVYPHADLVTYPSHYEGFGNAFLEAVYFGKPVVVNTYAVYARDIDPLGFKTIELTQLVTQDVVEQVRAVLHDEAVREDWAKTNYALGVKYFSYAVARRKLAARLANLFGEGV